MKSSSQLWDILSKLDPYKVDVIRMGNPFQFHLLGENPMLLYAISSLDVCVRRILFFLVVSSM